MGFRVLSVDLPLGATTKSSNNFELKLAKKAGCKGATKRRNQAKLVADFGGCGDQKNWSIEQPGFWARKIRNWCSQVTKQNRLLVQEKGKESLVQIQSKQGNILCNLSFHLNFNWRNLNVFFYAKFVISISSLSYLP